MGFIGDLFSSGDQETRTRIPNYAKDAVKPYAEKVAGFNYNPEFFPGQDFATNSPFTEMAIQNMGNFSNQPSQDYWSSVMRGDYLGLNPAMQQAVMNPAMEQTNSYFNQLGRFGSNANMENTAEAGMRALMPYYNAERDRMGQGAQMLPQLQAGQNQQNLAGGQLAEARQQRFLDRDKEQHYFNQDAGLRNLQAQQGLLGPLFGNPSVTTGSTEGMSNLQGLLGLGITGAGMFAGGPMSAAAGMAGMFGGMGGGGSGGMAGMGVPTGNYSGMNGGLGWW